MTSAATSRAPVLFVCCSLLLLVLTACGGSSGPAPRIVEFEAQPATVYPGETVVLQWRVDDLGGGRLRLESLAENEVEPATLGEVTAQNSTALVVEETTTFRLVAAGSGGTASQEATVTVVEPPPDPPRISYFRKSDGDGEVTLEWEVTGALGVTLEPLDVELDPVDSVVVDPCTTTEYRLHASNPGGSEEASLTVEVDGEECLLFLIAGQSNASGYGAEQGGGFSPETSEQPEPGVMLLNGDREWVIAQEPTHENGKHSFLVRFGKKVKQVTGKRVFMIPAAVSGSPLRDWQPDSEHFEEAMRLANHAVDSLGIPFSAVVWYQGESDTKSASRRRDFAEATDDTLRTFHARLPGEPEVVFVQLSKRLWSEELDDPGDNIDGHNLAYQEVRERQRLMEVGARTAVLGGAGESESDRPYYYMAVAHDLPMSDAKHLSAEGQRILGERIADVYLACIATECDVPPGPRLEGLSIEPTLTGSAVLIDLSEAVTIHPDYDGYFAVFVDGSERTDFTVAAGADASVIRLEFGAPFPAEAQVEVRYMPPQSTPLFTRSENVIRDLDDDLPLPAFGMPVESPPPDPIPGLRYAD